MSELVIRKACDVDFGDIYALEQKCFADPWSANMFDSFKRSNVTEAAVAELDGTICGFACIYVFDGTPECPCGDTELADIAVEPGCRRMGIAKKLLEHVYVRSKERFCSNVFLEVRESNTAARGLYESEGFCVTGRRKNYYASPREDAVLMKKELTAK
ncbi:MAG: ribosomal protein S18-alanine N-acetyltransferase [Clostridia bacterium]|nr:ribosomal protein S18-alanine N-acetyltransferase [Clostridia bacterium]